MNEEVFKSVFQIYRMYFVFFEDFLCLPFYPFFTLLILPFRSALFPAKERSKKERSYFHFSGYWALRRSSPEKKKRRKRYE